MSWMNNDGRNNVNIHSFRNQPHSTGTFLDGKACSHNSVGAQAQYKAQSIVDMQIRHASPVFYTRSVITSVKRCKKALHLETARRSATTSPLEFATLGGNIWFLVLMGTETEMLDGLAM